MRKTASLYCIVYLRKSPCKITLTAVFCWQENGYGTLWSIRAGFCLPKASISVHFPALKLRISAGKRWIVRISKTCAGIRTFLQPLPETDRPNRQTGLVTGPD